jgi:hypothetical protein
LPKQHVVDDDDGKDVGVEDVEGEYCKAVRAVRILERAAKFHRDPKYEVRDALPFGDPF